MLVFRVVLLLLHNMNDKTEKKFSFVNEYNLHTK
jgi:hypothetical protein